MPYFTMLFCIRQCFVNNVTCSSILFNQILTCRILLWYSVLTGVGNNVTCFLNHFNYILTCHILNLFYQMTYYDVQYDMFCVVVTSAIHIRVKAHDH